MSRDLNLTSYTKTMLLPLSIWDIDLWEHMGFHVVHEMIYSQDRGRVLKNIDSHSSEVTLPFSVV